MTLRRYSPMKKSAGTRIPPLLRLEVLRRDGGCVGPRVGMEGPCFGGIELDHVRAGGMGLKSATEASNLVAVCASHHRHKTENGRIWRPKLLAWIDTHGVKGSAE